MEIRWCPEACARAWWQADSSFPHLGQHNCPHRFGVTYAAAVIDGRVNCEHFKPKEVDKWTV